MKTLELKHLAIAMANGQEVEYFDDERVILHMDLKIVELRDNDMTIANGEYQYDVSFDDVRLVCRPPSQLTQEIEHNGEKFVPCRKMISYGFHHSFWTLTDEFDYKILYAIDLEKLLEWHFDVFGLIEQELAIEKI